MTVEITRAPDRFLVGAPPEIVDLWVADYAIHFLLDSPYRSREQEGRKRLVMLVAVRLGSGEIRVSTTTRAYGPRPERSRKMWTLIPLNMQVAVRRAVKEFCNQFHKPKKEDIHESATHNIE